MRGKQVVTAPNGGHWQVGRRWLNKPPPKPWSRRKRRKQDDGEDGASWLDPAGFVDVGDDFLAGIVVALVVAAAIALLVFAILPLLDQRARRDDRHDRPTVGAPGGDAGSG
jgi:hypothetical protein